MKITLDPNGLLLHEAPGITTVIHRGHPAFSDLIKATGLNPQELAPDDQGCGWPTYQPDDEPDNAFARAEAEEDAEEGERLAKACAARWNEREADGDQIPVDELEADASVLEGLGWCVEFTGQQWVARPCAGVEGCYSAGKVLKLSAWIDVEEPIALSTAHAPEGGISIVGKRFEGGQFIPGPILAQASDEERAKIEHKEKHELTRDQFLKTMQQTPEGKGQREALLKQWHEKAVRSAVRAGQTVPAHILEEYPRIKPNKPKEPAAPTTSQRLLKGDVVNMPVESLEVDPERFQFKQNVDKSGVTSEMKEVRQWNPDFAGVLAVWKDPADGKTYVVNGHHRRELAGRLGVKNLAVRYIDAKDAKEARAVGALINIAEGRGTAMDAAKFMRDTGRGPEDMAKEGVSLKGKVSADAVVLTKLSDRLFDKVARGTMPQDQALAIARNLSDHNLQDQLAVFLAKREDDGKEYTTKVIEDMAKEMAETPTQHTTEASLFGDIESDESLFGPRNELKTAIRSDLSKAVNDFAAVASTRRAAAVGKAGNVLDVEANRRIALESERVRNVFDKLVNRKGPISDALNAGAEEYAKAKGRKARDDIREKTVDAVRNAVFAEAGIGNERPGLEPGLPGGPAAPAGGEPAHAEASAPDGGRDSAERGGVKRTKQSYIDALQAMATRFRDQTEQVIEEHGGKSLDQFHGPRPYEIATHFYEHSGGHKNAETNLAAAEHDMQYQLDQFKAKILKGKPPSPEEIDSLPRGPFSPSDLKLIAGHSKATKGSEWVAEEARKNAGKHLAELDTMVAQMKAAPGMEEEAKEWAGYADIHRRAIEHYDRDPSTAIQSDDGGFIDAAMSVPAGETHKESAHREAAKMHADATAEIERVKGEIKDWESKQYKKNDERVQVGGEHGESYSIGGINEHRRKRAIDGLYRELHEHEETAKKAKARMDRAGDGITHATLKSARRAISAGRLSPKGSATSTPIKSALSGLPIRRYVELEDGSKIHPDELARADVDADGNVTLGPEDLTVHDPLNHGPDIQPSFERAVATVAAYGGHDDDPVTIQSPHGYPVKMTRGEWRPIARDLLDYPEAFAQWYDRENPAAESDAAKNAKATAKPMSDREQDAFFAPHAEQGRMFQPAALSASEHDVSGEARDESGQWTHGARANALAGKHAELKAAMAAHNKERHAAFAEVQDKAKASLAKESESIAKAQAALDNTFFWNDYEGGEDDLNYSDFETYLHDYGEDAPAYRFQHLKEIERMATAAQQIKNPREDGDPLPPDAVTELHANLKTIAASAKEARQHLKEHVKHRKEMKAIKSGESVSLSAALDLLDPYPAISFLDEAIALGTAHAPSGHTATNLFYIGGKGFQGGQFIPGAVYERGTDEEKAETVQKEPHELTREEFAATKAAGERAAVIKRWHEKHVREAVKAGHAVPEHVLAEYPAVKAKAAKVAEKAAQEPIIPAEEDASTHTMTADDIDQIKDLLHTEAPHEELETDGGGSDREGLHAEQPLGSDAEKASDALLSRPGEGPGERSGAVLPGDDLERGGIRGNAAGLGDGSAPGPRADDGAPSTDGAGGSGPAGEVAIGEQRSEPGSSGIADASRDSLKEPAAPDNPTDLAAGNWHYDNSDFARGGLKAKFRQNVEAIKVLQAMRAEGRDVATPAEQEVLARYVGWGAYPAVFNDLYDTDQPRLTAAEKEQLRETLSPEEFSARFDYGAWEKEKDQLKALLTDEEWKSARRSTLNAHFTNPHVVDAHWKMAQRLGFKGGRFLETSAGIGYYLGQMPRDLAAHTHTSAVELDSLTGDMLSKLYPAAHCQTQGFQDHLSPDNFYDLVASNVPFGDYGVHDPSGRYTKHDANIHDFFFLKSADIVRPGGLVMHITSTGTMDKGDDAIRQELAKTCDLVSAIRFPGGAHKENAGTEVVTDMLILRKRAPGEAPSGPDWMGTTTVPDPAGGEPIPVNKYFADHPEQILGTLDRTGTMYRGEQKNVSLTEDYDQRLQAAIDRLPEGLMKPAPTSKKAFEPEQMPAPGDVRVGGYKIEGGKLFRREGGALIEQQIKPKDLARVKGQLEIRDAYRAVINAQSAGQDSTAAQADLNRVYDAYVKKEGFLNAQANRRAFKADPDSPNMLALEQWDPKTKTATKAAMFSKNTVGHVGRVEHAGSVGEALGVSLHESGHLNIDRMAELMGKDKSHVANALTEAGIAYEDPGEGWKPADQYLSGNVRRKLTMAKAAAAADPRFNANVEALEKVQPEDIPAGGDEENSIGAKLGASWIPPSDIAQFAAEVLSGRPDHFHINYTAKTGQWDAEYSKAGKYTAHSSAAVNTWGVKDENGNTRAHFMDVLNAALTGKSITIRDRIDEDHTVVNAEATKAAHEKTQALKEVFKNWLWEDDERRTRLHRYYNDNFNNIRPMSYDGSHLQFPGMNPAMKLRDHQKNFVWQVVTTGKGLAAHEVGTGKTFSMIAAAMELRRLGLAKKPAIACLKSNVEAITQDALKLYPGARILSTADVFDKASRQKTIAQIATGDYDLIIMTHDNMNMLKMKPETQQKYINEELAELRAAKIAAQKEDHKGSNKNIVKNLQKAEENLEAKLKDILAKAKDDNVHFEDLGIDQLFVDEAHKFKSLPVITKGDRVKGVPNGRSDRATSMLMRARWLQEHNGGRGVVFATGTPVANTMAELYNMQRYLQPEELKERGIDNFDAWANQFGDRETKTEIGVTGKYQPVTRFSKFVNIPELMQIARQVIDVQRTDAMKNKDGTPAIVRPQRKDTVIAAPHTASMDRFMEGLQKRADEIKKRHGPPKEGDDNMLNICTDGRKASLDMRLVDPDAIDDPNSKTNMAVKNVLKIAKERPGTTQLIFSDVGVNPMKVAHADEADDVDDDEDVDDDNDEAASLHLYGDVIDKLVKGGIPREQIADFSKLKGAAKEAAGEALRRGDIRVAIGSTEKLGTGVNVQNKVAAMHHLDVPWVPAYIEQRDGRGWRQGNINDPSKIDPATGKPDPRQQEVQVYRYVTEGSLDQMFWQVVGNKAGFIRQVMTPGGNVQRIAKNEDTEQLSPEQLAAAASGDPRILEKVGLEADIKALHQSRARHDREQHTFKEKIEEREADAEHHAEQAQKHAADVAHLEANPDFALEVDGTTHDEREAAHEALHAAGQRFDKTVLDKPSWQRRNEEEHVATYRGMPVYRKDQKFYLEGPSGHRYETGDSLASLEAVARNIHKHTAIAERGVASAKKDVESLKGQVGKVWPKAAELTKKMERVKAIDEELSGKNNEHMQGWWDSLSKHSRKMQLTKRGWEEQHGPATGDESLKDLDSWWQRALQMSFQEDIADGTYKIGQSAPARSAIGPREETNQPAFMRQRAPAGGPKEETHRPHFMQEPAALSAFTVSPTARERALADLRREMERLYGPA